MKRSHEICRKFYLCMVKQTDAFERRLQLQVLKVILKQCKYGRPLTSVAGWRAKATALLGARHCTRIDAETTRTNKCLAPATLARRSVATFFQVTLGSKLGSIFHSYLHLAQTTCLWLLRSGFYIWRYHEVERRHSELRRSAFESLTW